MFRSPAKQTNNKNKSSTFSLVLYRSSLLRLTHLSDAELVQAFVMSKNCNLVGHSGAYADPVINLWGKCSLASKIEDMDANQKFCVSFSTKKKVTHLPRGEEVASLDRFKDERAEVRGSREVRLRQRLLHLLDLHQTQGPVLP